MRKLMLVLAVAALAVLGTSCNQLKARDQLNKGVQAFKNAQYADAVESFKKAVDLDPNFPTARLYLATAYMQQYIPGAESPENMKMAQAAFENFQKVLEQEPKNEIAIASIASLNLNQKKWDEAQNHCLANECDQDGVDLASQAVLDALSNHRALLARNGLHVGIDVRRKLLSEGYIQILSGPLGTLRHPVPELQIIHA